MKHDRLRNGIVLILSLLVAADIAMRARTLPTTVHAQTHAQQIAELRRDATVRAVEKTGPAVANISAEHVVVQRVPPEIEAFYNQFGESLQRREVARSLGSGVVIDPQGYIVTNAHVVQRATKIVVTLPDNRDFSARLLSMDASNDLALLKIDAGTALPFLALGTSSDLMPGETVVALGNPFGLENSVTRGVISARDRKIRKDDRELEGTFLQTDAAINPGNSGGPLIDLDAELVGINTAIHAGGQGIGFAIPVDRVKQVLSSLSDPEQLDEVWLGVKLADAPDGVHVTGLEDGSPASATALSIGDVVEAAQGSPASTVFELHKLWLTAPEGAPMTLGVRSKDGSRHDVSLAPATPPSHKVIETRLGIVPRNLTPAAAWQQGLDVDGGVLVSSTVADGPAARIGVASGDVLTKVARVVAGARLGTTSYEILPVPSTADLARCLEKVAKGEKIAIFVLRSGRELQGELKLD
jgi:serine protease Do